jgi:transposase-like protein
MKPFSDKASPLDLHETERRLIAQALATTKGNITAAAKKLGISRRTLHRKINEMNAAKTDGDSAATSVGEAASFPSLAIDSAAGTGDTAS